MNPIYEKKLAEAKAQLGKRYIMHPEYVQKNNPAHKFPGSFILLPIRIKAMVAGRIV